MMRAISDKALAARLVLGCLLLALAGCASTPQATPERDAEAKQFIGHPGFAGIYIYRPGLRDREVNDPFLYVDERLLGAVLAGSFFRVDVQPGARVVRSTTFGSAELKLDARAGEFYFARLEVTGNDSRLALVDAENAKREIRKCCALMENWAPGQRPLLR